MTVEPNMFLQQATAGKAQIISDPANTFVNQVCTILGATAAASVSPAVTSPTGLHHINIALADVATATFTYVTLDKIEIVDVICRKSGAGAANTVQIKDGAANAISNAIATDTDKTITRAGTIDPAFNTIAAAGSIQVTATRAAGSMLCNVTLVVRRV